MAAHLSRRGFLGGAAVLHAAALSAPRASRAAIAMGFDEARHLLSRTTFGGTPAEIRAVQDQDYAATVDRLLDVRRPKALTPAPAWITQDLAELRTAIKAAREKKTGVDGKPLEIVRPAQEQVRELRNWWVEEMLATDQPLVERMTLFWHNHFTSSHEKVIYTPAMYRQNELFRREALGNFGRLLLAIARDPAMLIYLDGVRSKALRPNENFARELLELFTLGEGHYTEDDIRNAARAFTGWTIERESGVFRINEQAHDAGMKMFLGESGAFAGEDIVAILLRQPRTAELVVEKLWREFVSLIPDPTEVKRLAAVLRNGNYEMKPVLRAMFLSPAFREPSARGALIKSPIDLIVGSVHLLGLPVPEKTQLVRMLQGLGQLPFSPPNVKGWVGGEAWITTYTLLLRQQFLRRMIEATTVSSMDGSMAISMRPNRRAERKEQAPAEEPMQQLASEPARPVEGRSLRHAGLEARLGPTLAGLDAVELKRVLLPLKPIDGGEANGPPGAVVASAMLDPAYQLK
ncbi:MAG: DUF1800 domain-containing protein [Enhydrobacter sp.]|nr:DUF1800 domain-containing protein [Enhydrobacter sp.]